LTGHEGPVFCLKLLANGKLVSGSGDNIVKIWNIEKGICLKSLESHSRDVRCIEIIPKMKRLLTGSNDLSVKL